MIMKEMALVVQHDAGEVGGEKINWFQEPGKDSANEYVLHAPFS